MAYRFKLREELCEGVRRIGVEQIAKVLDAPHDGDNRAVWVHETRKTMKRTRALLKCVRSGLGDGPYRAENTALRDIARNLSGLRDRDVMAGTIASLTGQDKKLDDAFAWLTKQLHAPRDEGAAEVLASPDTVVRQAVKALQKAKDRFATIDVAGEFGETVGAGLRTSQRVGREALARLTAEPTDENVHDLRKAVQTYQRQQSLVLAVWPEMQSVRVEAARALAQLLGEAQDFAVLADTARSTAEKASPAQATHGKRVATACRKRQELIRAIAVPMASRLFATRPKSVEQELKAGWEAAVSLAAAPHQPTKAQVSGAS
ncbi:MAG: CHAD domain-containing protein [Hyphomicrobiaceae bacterium]